MTISPQSNKIFRSRFVRQAVVLLTSLLAVSTVHAQKETSLLGNPGFEDEKSGWSLYVPDESQGKNCQFTVVTDAPHGGDHCAVLESSDNAKYCISIKGIPAAPGDRFHVVFWIKAGRDAEARSGEPGFYARFLFRQAGGKELPGTPAIFVGVSGTTVYNEITHGYNVSSLVAPLPTDWKKVEAVFEIPKTAQGITMVDPGFFAYYTKGSIYLDDVSIAKVDPKTPLTH